jgi:hypothetical protein
LPAAQATPLAKEAIPRGQTGPTAVAGAGEVEPAPQTVPALDGNSVSGAVSAHKAMPGGRARATKARRPAARGARLVARSSATSAKPASKKPDALDDLLRAFK